MTVRPAYLQEPQTANIMRRLSSDPEAELTGSFHANTTDISEDHDLIMSSDGETTQLYDPPPHIAARFHRPPNNRRKSSAASSRRNSISSLHSHHSHHSNRSSHGGPQSSHLAQHLRRASIIETRKARLADRAAHAEKVRLRAAMVKAAPRVSTTSEERVLAAQQARERYLAQVAANCAEEVKRAKKVAEDMKEKKAAEHLKLKWDMEEKLAEAEKRRALYQNSRRRAATGLPVVEEKKATRTVFKPLGADGAARVIQEAWKRSQRRQVVKEFLALGLTRDSLMTGDFEKAGELFSQTKVLTSTAKVLKLCMPLEGEMGVTWDMANVRTFLSSFLIVGHPEEVLSESGEQEQDLITKANELIAAFEHLLSTPSILLGNNPSQVHSESFGEAWSTFCTAFAAWKAKDSTVLVQTMIAQFVELDAIWQTVKGDTNGDVAADYHAGIDYNKTMLLARLKKLVGPDKALMMIRDAIRESRKAKARPAKRHPSDIKPRAAVTRTVGEATGSESRSLSIQLDDAQSTTISSAPRVGLHASELQRVLQPIPDNRVLVHELAIDREYTIKPQEGLQQIINRAVFDTMRTDVDAGIGDRWVVAMAETIRGRLLRLLAHGNSLHQLITEVLDTTIIENQVRMGSFSYERFFSFMATILPKLCAPFRDADVRALTEDQSNNPDMIERLAKLMRAIDLLSLDYSNFLLAVNAPTLIAEGPGYEQRRFAQDLETGAITLAKTYRWWRLAKAKALAEADRRTTENDTTPGNRPSPERIYIHGLVDLATGFGSLRDIDVPETLELDKARLSRLRADIRKIVTISTILLTAKNLLKRDVRSQWKAEATRIWDLLSETVPTDPVPSASQSQPQPHPHPHPPTTTPPPDDLPTKLLSTIAAAHVLPPATKSLLAATVRRVLAFYFQHPVANQQPTDHVMRVLHQKLRSHILTRCLASSATDRVRAASEASGVLAAGGMAEFVSRVGGLVEEVVRVGEVDRGSHGGWYEGVGRGVEGEMGDGDGATGMEG